MKIIYVAGRYRSKHWWGKWWNIFKARQKAKELCSQGYVVICPHMNTALFDGMHSDKFWLDASIELLSRLNPLIDKIYMMKGWETSEGARMERNKAVSMKMEIVYER